MSLKDEIKHDLDVSPFDRSPVVLAKAAERIYELSERIYELESQLSSAHKEASALALSLWKKFYKEDSHGFGFEPLDSVDGIISQIDNMTTGLEATRR